MFNTDYTMNTIMNCESILKVGANYYRTERDCSEKSYAKNISREYGIGKSEDITILGETKNVYIWLYDNHNDFMSESNINTYNTLMGYVNDIDSDIRKIVTEYFNENKYDIIKKMRNIYSDFYCDTLENYYIDESNIDLVSSLSSIVLDNGELSIVVSCHWGETIEIPVTNYYSESLKVYSEITTFRDLDNKSEDGIMIMHNAKIRSFLGENNKEFEVWLMRTYDEPSEIQEERFKDFKTRHKYYSDLLSDAMIKYYRVFYRQIKNHITSSDMVDYLSINRKSIKQLCSLEKVSLYYDGTMEIDIATEWDEVVTIRLWKENIPLTNSNALPMCGNINGPLNM